MKIMRFENHVVNNVKLSFIKQVLIKLLKNINEWSRIKLVFLVFI